MKFRLVCLVFNFMCIAVVPFAHAQMRGCNDSLMVSSGGFLWNRAWQYTNLSKFKGDVRDSIADAPLIRQVLFEANQAQLNSKMRPVGILQDKSDSCWIHSKTLLLHYFASTFNHYQDSSQFLAQNWDTAKHCFFYPKSYRIPVKTDTLVFFGSLQDSIDQGNVKLLLDADFVQNSWKKGAQYFISTEDTLHFSLVSVGVPFNCTLDTNIASHRLYLKAKVNNRYFLSSFSLQYTKSSIVFPQPDQIVNITSQISFKGITASLELGLWKSCLNTTGLNQPVIIVEGFDPQNSRTLLNANSAANNLYCISNASVSSHTNILDSLRAYGHDVLIVNFMDGGTFVEANAFALVAALNYVNTHKEGADELTLVGASMGGLVSRYALSYMERNKIPHHCRLWVTFDTPHEGASVPIGLQMMIDFIYANISQMPYAIQKQVPPLRDKVLNCPAAREMLLMHYTELQKGNNGPCPEFNTLYDSLKLWGFPSCRKIALSDGNHTGGNQGFNAGQQLIHFLLPTYPLIIEMRANAVSAACIPQTIFDGSIKMFIKGIPVNLNRATYTLNCGNGIDNASGGSNTFHMDVAKSLGIVHSKSTLGTCLMEEDNFVPVSSALAIRNKISYQMPMSLIMPNLSYLGRTHSTTISPFDVTYCMKNYYSSSRNATLNNAPHIIGGFDLDMMQLVSKEMMCRNYFLQNLKWTDLHEVEAITVSIGKNVSNHFLNGDFECNTNANAVIKAVDKIRLYDGVKILHPVQCQLTSTSMVYDPQCIQLATTTAFRNIQPSNTEIETPNKPSRKIQNTSIQVRPNPSSAKFTLNFDESYVGVQVLDIIGKLVFENINFHSGDSLNLEEMPDGIYFVTILGNPQSVTKIIKHNYE